MGKSNRAQLIASLVKKRLAARQAPKRSDDFRACARALKAALASGSEDDLAEALQAISDVSRGGDTSNE